MQDSNFTVRNIGLISKKHQDILRKTPIAVLGTGGLGGSLTEQLIRSGCEKMVIVDNQVFEKSNLNRQLCTIDDIGEYKVDVIKKLSKRINPEAEIRTYKKISLKNISEILKDVEVLALTLDDPFASILISRECSKNNINLIETFGLPIMWAWWFTSSSISYESFYGFGTHSLSNEELKKFEELDKVYYDAMMRKFAKIPRVIKQYTREANVLNEIVAGMRPFPTMAPIIRISASYLCYEIIFSGILKLKKMVHPPQLKGYDYFHMKAINLTLE